MILRDPAGSGSLMIASWSSWFVVRGSTFAFAFAVIRHRGSWFLVPLLLLLLPLSVIRYALHVLVLVLKPTARLSVHSCLGGGNPSDIYLWWILCLAG